MRAADMYAVTADQQAAEWAMSQSTCQMTIGGTLLEAGKGVVESTFPDVTGVEPAAPHDAQIWFSMWGEQITELRLLDAIPMQSQGSATIGGGRRILLGFESRGMRRFALSGISVVALGEWIAVSGRRLAVCVYFDAVRTSLRETDRPEASVVAR